MGRSFHEGRSRMRSDPVDVRVAQKLERHMQVVGLDRFCLPPRRGAACAELF